MAAPSQNDNQRQRADGLLGRIGAADDGGRCVEQVSSRTISAAWQLPRPLAKPAFRLKIGGANADAEGMPSDGGAMGARSVQELPVRILTDDELISEYDRTFESAVTPQSHNGYPARWDEGAMRRNSAAMGELLRRGYRSAGPEWMKPADA